MNWGGVLLVLGATFCWSTGGLIVRLVETSAPTIVFWRSVFLMLAVGGALLIKYRPLGLYRLMIHDGKRGALSGGLLACTFIGYVVALSQTTVANTVLLMSASPLIAALLARWLLKESLSKGAIFAIALAMAGIATMLADGVSAGGWLGNLAALSVAITFGANIVVLRKEKRQDMLPATLLAGLFSALAMLPFAQPLSVSAHDLGLLALMGFFQLGFGLFLFLRGVARLPAATAGLLTLGESIMAPLWVWLFLSETPSSATLIGGGILLLALAISARFQASS
jgi:drug/metabolite transporter (DMT)-like permease